MHELSLAVALVEQIALTAKNENARKVIRVVVVIGALSGVERSAFEFAFPLAAENTVAEAAELEIEESPATIVCNQCHCEFASNTMPLACENCGSDDITLRGGREFLIRSIELELT